MRYIGNKTKLLPFLRAAIARLGLDPGVVHDAFAGTAAVGRALKADGWRVHSSDLMTYSYVMQRAYVVASGVIKFETLAAADEAVRTALDGRHRGSLAGVPITNVPSAAARHAATAANVQTVANHLSRGIEPIDGFLSRHFAPAGGRMYFTEENARRIDAARTTLHQWRLDRLIGDDAYYVLLAAVIEGADRVANTAGVYAAYIKRWQPNALRPFAIVAEPPLRAR
jgi:adenine-specific DNA-methyltransferase